MVLCLNFELLWAGFVSFWSKSQIKNLKFHIPRIETIYCANLKTRRSTRLTLGTAPVVSYFSCLGLLEFGMYLQYFINFDLSEMHKILKFSQFWSSDVSGKFSTNFHFPKTIEKRSFATKWYPFQSEILSIVMFQI